MREFICTHLINTDYLLSNEFDKFIIDRAKKILDKIEVATGKSITDRDSQDVIAYFGESLKSNEDVY